MVGPEIRAAAGAQRQCRQGMIGPVHFIGFRPVKIEALMSRVKTSRRLDLRGGIRGRLPLRQMFTEQFRRFQLLGETDSERPRMPNGMGDEPQPLGIVCKPRYPSLALDRLGDAAARSRAGASAFPSGALR